jgi:hypothetical protein
MLHKTWTGTAWYPSPTDWEPLSETEIFASPPSVTSWGPGRLDLLCLTPGGQMLHKAWTGTAWSPPSLAGWENLYGQFQGPPPKGWTAATADDVANYAKSSTWLGYFGHGDTAEWGHNGFFYPSNVMQTATGSTLPLVYAVGCSTGQFTPGAPWHGPYIDINGTTHHITTSPTAQPGADGPAIIDTDTGQAWGLNCPPPCVPVSAAAPFVVPLPRAYDLPRQDPSFGYQWTIASAPGGGIAYIGEMSVAPPPPAQEMETYVLNAYARAASPVLGDIYLEGQQQYWANHKDDPGVQSSARIFLSFVTLFGDPSLRLHPLG